MGFRYTEVEKPFVRVIKRIPRRLKMKVYETVIRPVMLYGAETWVLRRKEERMLKSTEMKMLRRIKGVTKLDRQRNEDILEELGVTDILTKARQARLRWYGHLRRMNEESAPKKIWKMEIKGKRPRGRPQKRWMENVKEDMGLAGLRDEDTQRRTYWRSKIQKLQPGNRAGNGERR